MNIIQIFLGILVKEIYNIINRIEKDNIEG